MGKSRISWTEHTWNPLRVEGGRWGCTKVSPGCLNCYASRLNNRFGGREYDYKFSDWRFYLDDKLLMEPVRRKKPTIYFVCSVCDLFHEKVPAIIQEDMLQVMLDNPQHRFLVLTKRPESMRDSLSVFYANRDVPLMENVWCGVSAENQEMADKRIPVLFDCLAAHRFVSAEPLLGPIHFQDRHPGGIDWMIVGGESGPNYRNMGTEWVDDLAKQCAAASVRLFVKQDCGPRSGQQGKLPDHLWARKDNPVCDTL